MNPQSSSLSHDIPRTEVSISSKKGKSREVQKKSGRVGLVIERRFTNPGSDPLEQVKYEKRLSRISNTDGSIVFEMKDAEIPASWSQVATDIVVSKYFRRAGVPQLDEQGNIQKNKDGSIVTGPERSVKQVVSRLSGCRRHWGEKYG